MRSNWSSLATSTVVVLATAATLGLGCSHQRAPAAAAPTEERATANVPVVPSGLSFHARLDQPLDSERAHPDQHFTARLVDPLRASDGTVLAPRGAELHGRVLDVDRVGVGRLTLQFDGVTVHGRLQPIAAQIIRIDHASVLAADAANPQTLQAFVYPILPMRLPKPHVGGGPPPQHVPVVLRRGAEFQLVLSQPFGLTP